MMFVLLLREGERGRDLFAKKLVLCWNVRARFSAAFQYFAWRSLFF